MLQLKANRTSYYVGCLTAPQHLTLNDLERSNPTISTLYTYLAVAYSAKCHIVRELADGKAFRCCSGLSCTLQDTLLKSYIARSESGNIWPTAYNAPLRPMLLQPGIYTFSSLTRSFSDLAHDLRPGVLSVSRRCGGQLARSIEMLLLELSYYYYDLLNLIQMELK